MTKLWQLLRCFTCLHSSRARAHTHLNFADEGVCNMDANIYYDASCTALCCRRTEVTVMQSSDGEHVLHHVAPRSFASSRSIGNHRADAGSNKRLAIQSILNGFYRKTLIGVTKLHHHLFLLFFLLFFLLPAPQPPSLCCGLPLKQPPIIIITM